MTETIVSDSGQITSETTDIVTEQVETVVEEKTDVTTLATEETKVEQVVPESYKFSAPEDFVLDENMVSKFSEMAKGAKLSQEDAQKFVDFHIEVAKGMEEEGQKAFKDLSDGWVKSAKEDKEIGGMKFNENMGIVRKAIDQFGNKELKEALNLTGVGNHPEFLRFAYKVGKAIEEDKFHVGGNPDGRTQSIADILYPSMRKD